MANTDFDAVAGAINSNIAKIMGIVFDKTPNTKNLNDMILPQMFIIPSSDSANWTNLPESTGCTVLVFANNNNATPSRTLQFVFMPAKVYYRMILNGNDVRAWNQIV